MNASAIAAIPMDHFRGMELDILTPSPGCFAMLTNMEDRKLCHTLQRDEILQAEIMAYKTFNEQKLLYDKEFPPIVRM